MSINGRLENSQAPVGAACHTVKNMSPLEGLIGCMRVEFYKHAAPMALKTNRGVCVLRFTSSYYTSPHAFE
jgi:hypothetical protein